jgi:hypothetical protein
LIKKLLIDLNMSILLNENGKFPIIKIVIRERIKKIFLFEN